MFLSLLPIPIVRKLAGALLVLAALAAVVYAIYHAGAHAGAATEASQQVAATQSAFERIESSTRQRLDAADARARELAGLVERLSTQASAASTRAVAAESAAAADRSRIAALSDAAIKSDLQRQLGLPQKPAASLDDSATLRTLDARLSDCAHLADKTSALEQQVAALAAGSAARDSQLAELAIERDSALDAYNQLVPLYAQAFSAATKRHRRWFCLFVCRTGPHITIPNPITLAAPPRHPQAPIAQAEHLAPPSPHQLHQAPRQPHQAHPPGAP